MQALTASLATTIASERGVFKSNMTHCTCTSPLDKGVRYRFPPISLDTGSLMDTAARSRPRCRQGSRTPQCTLLQSVTRTQPRRSTRPSTGHCSNASATPKWMPVKFVLDLAHTMPNALQCCCSCSDYQREVAIDKKAAQSMNR